MNTWKERIEEHLEGDEPQTISDLVEPPCIRCVYWKPVKMWVEGSEETIGPDWQIRCCHVPEMKRDFTCFTRPDETEAANGE